MRAQSAIEFLSTYSFLFIVLGIVIGLLLFIGTAAVGSVPQQCNSFSGPNCNFVHVYSNALAAYSLVTLAVTNSQSVPINITNISVIVKSIVFKGVCAPQFLYPGQGATCVVNMTTVLGFGAVMQGVYSINARYCNSGVSAVSTGNCTYERVMYGGSFTTSVSKNRVIVFSVASSVSPKMLQLVPVQSSPGTPRNYTILQNGIWVSNLTGGTIPFAFATPGSSKLGTAASFGSTYALFPQSTSTLDNGNVVCSNTLHPWNSTMSVASTSLYISNPQNANVILEAKGAIEFYYANALVSIVTPNNALSWTANGNWMNNNQWSGSSALSLKKGLYSIEIMWSDACDSAYQGFQLSGIPN